VKVPVMSLHELWESNEADLVRARDTLPESALNNDAVRRYEEYIDNNELELACDTLAPYGQDHPVNQVFWLALRDAATKMELPNQASLYEKYCESP
jgi:hypothetical protein